MILILLLIFVSLYLNIFILQDETSANIFLYFGSFCFVLLNTFYKASSPLNFFVFIVGAIIGRILCNLFLSYSLKKSLKNIETVYSENSIKAVYDKLNSRFFLDIRNAFICGHQCVFEPNFYETILSQYKVNENLIVHSQRILSVYNSQVLYLEKFNKRVTKKNCSIKLKIFNKGIKKIINARKKLENGKFLKVLNDIELNIILNRRHLISYWKAVQSFSYDKVLTLSEICKKEEKQIVASYENLLLNYEMCPIIYRSFIKYLKHTAFDKETADIYKDKLTFIEGSNGNEPDILEMSAKSIFNRLPPRVGVTTNNNMMYLDDASFTISEEETDNNSYSAAKIRQTCRDMKIKNGLCLKWVILLSFIIPFCIGIVALLIFTIGEFINFDNLLEFASCFTSLLLKIPKNSYDILSNGLINKGAMNKISDEFKILGEEVNNVANISRESIQISELIDSYIRDIPQLKANTNLGQYEISIECLIYTFINESDIIQRKQKMMHYESAINIISGDFLSYSNKEFNNGTDFSGNPWYLSIVTNENEICGVLNKFGQLIISDLIDSVNRNKKLGHSLPLMATWIEVIFILLEMFIIYRFTKENHNILKIMSKIPSFSIIQICNKLEVSNETQDIHSKHILESCEYSWKRSRPKIVIMLILFSNFLLIFEMWGFNIKLSEFNLEIKSLPVQKYYISLFSSIIYRQISLIKRCIAINNGKGVDFNQTELFEKFSTNLKYLERIYDELFLGTNISDEYSLIKYNYDTTKIFFKEKKARTNDPYDILCSSSTFTSIELFIDKMRVINSNLANSKLLNKDNKIIVGLLHFVSDNLLKVVYEAEEKTNRVNEIIYDVLNFSLYFAIVIFIVNTILIIIIVVNIDFVINTLRFNIISLGMLNREIFSTNEALRTIIEGKFDQNVKNEVIKEHFITEIQSKTEELIIYITKHEEISFMNDAAKKFFNENHISLISEFIFIDKEIRDIIESKKYARINFNHKFENTLFKIEISKTKNSNEAIFIASIDKEKEEMENCIVEKEKSRREILQRIIPHDIRDMYSPEDTIINSSHVIVIAVKVFNINLDENDINKTLETISYYRNSFYECSKNVLDCSLIKKIGLVTISVLNLRNKYKHISDILDDTFEYIKSIYLRLKERNIKMAASLCYETEIQMGRISSTSADFNLYGSEIENVYSTACRGKESEIRINNISLSNLPKKYVNNISGSDNFGTYLLCSQIF